MAIDITQIIFASSLDTLKNYSTTTGTISVPSTSYSAGQYKTYSTTVTLDFTDGLTQRLFNFSTDSTKYYVGDTQVAIDANFSAQVRSNIVGTVLTVDCYVINQTGGAVSVPAFDVGIRVKRFVGPFN